jgi:hypothetical protein
MHLAFLHFVIYRDGKVSLQGRALGSVGTAGHGFFAFFDDVRALRLGEGAEFGKLAGSLPLDGCGAGDGLQRAG